MRDGVGGNPGLLISHGPTMVQQAYDKKTADMQTTCVRMTVVGGCPKATTQHPLDDAVEGETMETLVPSQITCES